jgi:uncharacterized protein YktB (UPF0637 family)
MENLGFTREDMAVFGTDSLEKRRLGAQDRLRPRLEAIAYRFAPPLSRLAGENLSAVITLPDEGGERQEATASFVKTGGGVDSAPYFSFVVTRGGVHARLIIERAVTGREEIARRLTKAAGPLSREIGDQELRCYDDWDGRGIPASSSASKPPFWKEVAARLGKQTGRLDLGLGWPEARAVLLSYEDLVPAFRRLVPIYRYVH